MRSDQRTAPMPRAAGQWLAVCKKRNRLSAAARPRVEAVEGRLLLSTYTVTTNADSGTGSLRQAILSANASSGTDTVAFNLPAGQQTIKLASALPTVTDPIILDGTTQPGYAGKPLVELRGGGTGFSLTLEINAGMSTVKGFVFDGVDSQNGVDLHLNGSGNNVIQGNYFGTDPTGTMGQGDGFDILIDNSSGNLLGGTQPGQGNLISGGGGISIFEDDPGTGVPRSLTATGFPDNNIIQGNLIGTDATGAVGGATNKLGNDIGIQITGGANNLIGGTVPGARNVIAGNTTDIFVGISEGLTIQGNYIGTNAAGTSAFVPPKADIGEDGVFVDVDAGPVLIGGAAPGAGNLIAGCSDDNILIDASGVKVRGNLIGTDATGTHPIGNGQIASQGDGVGVEIIGGDNNAIGGVAPGEGNVIAFNFMQGVGIADTAGAGNSIQGNSIFSNGALGIDLKEDGVTLNTPGGPHTGSPNHLQNFPVLTFAASGTAGTTIAGTLNSTPSSTFRVELFSNALPDPSGNGQGQTFLGFVSVDTDANGNGPFRFTTPTRVPVGQVISATATSAKGDTSEFSADLKVTLLGDVNGDGKVGFADLLVLAQHYGKAGTLSQGDVNGDGTINFSDLLVLAQNYGATAADPLQSLLQVSRNSTVYRRPAAV